MGAREAADFRDLGAEDRIAPEFCTGCMGCSGYACSAASISIVMVTSEPMSTPPPSRAAL